MNKRCLCSRKGDVTLLREPSYEFTSYIRILIDAPSFNGIIVVSLSV